MPSRCPNVRAIRATAAGGPDVLELADLPDPEPAADEVLVRVAAAGVNFIDTYRRSGVYAMPFPHVVGSEGAGTVVAVGADVSEIAVGDRVAWSSAPGSYAELVAVRASKALLVPEGVSDQVAAALPLQGLTAHYLVTSTFPVQAGHDVLVHAAAGGVGLLLTQLASQRGARVIATVGSAEKERLAREAGAADVIRYRELDDLTRDLPAEVRRADRRPRRARRLRLRRQGHVRRVARLAAPPRHARPVRRRRRVPSLRSTRSGSTRAARSS